jgi:hypothetical protein
MRNTLICTVGTSLWFGLGKLEESNPLRQGKDARNWKQVSLALLDIANTERICGAEINSITSLCGEGLLDRRDRLVFLLSDTKSSN